VIQLKSPISLKLGPNVEFGDCGKKVGQNISFPSSCKAPRKSKHLIIIYA